MMKREKDKQRLITSLAFILTLFALLPRAAYAYIDPGTGSLIFQLIIAVGVGSLFMLKVFWHKIKKLFTPKKKRDDHG